MRAYHHFSTNHSLRRLIAGFSILFLPLLGLLFFSKASGIPFTDAVSDMAISTWRLAVAFVLSTALAWVLVVVFIRGKTEHPTLAIFDVMQSLPTFTILPIAVTFLGDTDTTIILFLAITIIWPIIFSIVSALKQADKSWHEAVIISRIDGLDYIRYYLLPVTMPGVVTGAIIGLGDGWEALIATELLLKAPAGLGSFFNQFSTDTRMTFFGVLIFLSFVFALNKFIWLPLLEKSHRLVEQ